MHPRRATVRLLAAASMMLFASTAFDPLLSNQSATAEINSVIYRINWESLQPGPIGEYVEVIDYDPTIKKFYEPVDLNNDYLLAQDFTHTGRKDSADDVE